MEELEKMSLVELRLYGRKLGMKNATTFKKQELIGEIKKILNSNEPSDSREQEQEQPQPQSRYRKPAPRQEVIEEELEEPMAHQEMMMEAPQTRYHEREMKPSQSRYPSGGQYRSQNQYPSQGQYQQSPYQQHTPYQSHGQYQPPYQQSQYQSGDRYQSPYPSQEERSSSRTPVRRSTRNSSDKRAPMQERRPYSQDRRPSSPRPMSRGGYTSNYQEVHSTGKEDRRYSGYPVREDRRSLNREERSNPREDSYNYGYHEEPGAPRINPRGDAATITSPEELARLDSGETKSGILEVMSEGYGFIRCDNYLPGEADVYVSPAMIRRFGLRTGDILVGNTRIKTQSEKFSALLYIDTINGYSLEETAKRVKFEHLTPIFPNERIRLEVKGSSNNIAMRMMDIISPIGKGQRGMIVSQPKTGKTTLLKQVATSVTKNYPKMKLIVLLIDERPEEVTDIKESIQGDNVEVIYSTFDELPENHKRVSEMVIERAKRLVEHGEDVMILLDSITRLARAYNLTVQPSGRTLSGGLDPAALHMPKRFFGAARNMREGGSLTILATALVDTGSKMDDVVFEEFKGTGNMEMVLDRSLSEKRLFPAIDLPKSSTRRDDLLLDQEETEANFLMRKAFAGAKSDEAVENIIAMFRKTKDNDELVQLVRKVKIV